MAIEKADFQKVCNEPAVTCCQFPAGTVLGLDNLSGPELFDDMIDANLMEPVAEDAFKVKEIIGRTLAKEIGPMTSITPEYLEA